MTISRRTIQLVAAGATFGLLSLCGLVAGGASFFLPAEKNWWLIAGTACLPMLLGIGLAFLAYFGAGRMIEDEADSPPASAPTLIEDRYSDLTTVEPRAKKADKRLFLRLVVGLGVILILGLDVLAFAIWRWEALELVAIEVVLTILATGVYFLLGWIQTRPAKWMDETGWPVISGLCVLATVGFFVFAVGGPVLGQTLSGWFGQILPGLPGGMTVIGTVLGYVVWAIVAVCGLYVYNRLVDGGSPSKGIIALTISLPILAIVAFFGFGLIEGIAGSFAEVWLLYAILAAILTAVFVDQTESTQGGPAALLVSLAIFGAAWLISWAILSAVGATWGMFGQGAAIVAVAIAYGIYLSWERGEGGKP